MKIQKEKIIYPVQSSFKILKYTVPYFDMPFHYHPEYELVYIVKGSGLRYVGSSIQKFKAGDMVFIGPDLAHIWVSPKKHPENTAIAEAIVLQFSIDLFRSLIETPEFYLIKQLMQKSHSGLSVSSETKTAVLDLLEKILQEEGVKKLILLIKILDTLSRDKKMETLSLTNKAHLSLQDDKRINAIFHLVMSGFHKKITIADAANIANMEQSAFCRFFKEKTKKTFTRFLNEKRIDHACSLLLKQNLTVSQVAYECGFNNMANFYRQFKKITGVTPGEYIKY